jgi:AraC-like DNA-binding protein
MKKYVLLTVESNCQVNFESLGIAAGYQVSQSFDWQELQRWIQHLVNRKKNLHQEVRQADLHPKAIAVVSQNEQFRQRIMKIVEDNMANPDFGVDVFARAAGMSTAQLYRKLIALTGYAPNDFMRHMRLQRAADLLMRQAGNVSEIGYQVGFCSLSYFSKCFKEKFGVLPSAYFRSEQTLQRV